MTTILNNAIIHIKYNYGVTIMNTIKITDKRTTLMVAHRGLSGIERENTNSAFVAAGNRSYFGIECDVHRTLDGKFVIFHDDKTARVAIDNMVVEESTFETLRSLRLTDKDGERGRTDLLIPSLEEYISICKKYEKVAVLELKNDFEEADISRICDIIEDLGHFNNTIFISFSYDNMVKLKSIRPDAKAQYLTSSFGDDLIEKLLAYRLDLDIYYKALTAENISLCHSNEIKVNCWTVDDKEIAERLINWGVDYITSNILE